MSSSRSVISSMLLKPAPWTPRIFTAPKRLETFWIGVPSVFQTAPPQPRSNARCTCAPEFAGGAEASQNGFGDLIPAQFVARSGMALPPQVLVDRARGALALRRRVDDFHAAVRGVAAGEPARAAGRARRVRHHAAAVEPDAGELREHPLELRLADRDEDELGGKRDLAAGDRALVVAEPLAAHALDLAAAFERDGDCPPLGARAFDSRGAPFVLVAAHFLGASAVEHRHARDPEAARFAQRVE